MSMYLKSSGKSHCALRYLSAITAELMATVSTSRVVDDRHRPVVAHVTIISACPLRLAGGFVVGSTVGATGRPVVPVVYLGVLSL